MKKYKLKKDTLTTKAGAIFTRVDGSLGDIIAGPRDAGGDISIEVSDLADFDEWFEEVKEFEEWKPKEDEVCKRIGITCGVYVEAFSADDLVHEFRLSIGGLYPLDTPDEVIIKEQKLIPQAMQRLKVAAKKAWFKFNGSEGPDWSESFQNKWAIRWCHSTMTVQPFAQSTYQTQGVVYFPTVEACMNYADNNPDDLKLLFGVE